MIRCDLFRRRLSVIALLLGLSVAIAACGKKEDQTAEKEPNFSGGQSGIDIPEFPSQQTVELPPEKPAEPEKEPLKPAELGVIPLRSTIPPTQAGSLPVRRTFTLTNRGEEPLEIKSLRLSGDNEQFTLGAPGEDSCQDGTVIEGGGVCTILVNFTALSPIATTTKADILVIHSARAEPHIIELTGQTLPATPAAAAAPVVAPPQVTPAPPYETLNTLQITRQRQEGKATVKTQTGDPSSRNFILDSNQDHSDIGFPPTISTLPVNRSLIITADRYIPAVLENTVHSEISEGRITAVIERNVFGSDSRYVLIPAGSRAVGQLTDVTGGSARLAINWTRIIRPDGVGIAIQSPSADVMGRSGLVGDVDLRILERFGRQLLISVIEAVTAYSSDAETTSEITSSGNTQVTNNAKSRALERLFEGTGDVAEQIAQDLANVRPVTTIPAGTRFYIIPTQDIYFARPTLITAAEFDSQIKLTERQARGNPDTPTAAVVDTNTGLPQVPAGLPQPQIAGDNSSSPSVIERATQQGDFIPNSTVAPPPPVDTLP